ncbi:MAG TPA: hypothetical protein HPP58_08145 [Deltaproteobacteria bacterium]|nr:hypothetical protein [Deltaproteobacteria bacterium]HIJ41960.1 hypothetical protein [Deltaproteobacteria bacterium]
MSVFWFRSFGGRHAFRSALLVTVLFLTASFCFADSQGDNIVSSSVVIESKGDGGIKIGGRKFLVTEATRIFDLLGKSIPICDLPVPSEAVVEYIAVDDKEPECLKIEVTRLLRNSEIGPKSKDSD